MTLGTGRTTDLLPPLAGAVLVILFIALGFWQLDRAEQKRELHALFEAGGSYLPLEPGRDYRLYQPVETRGHYLPERQFLIDNMIHQSRVGYYVVTPFEPAVGGPLLLVNRGWAPKPVDPGELAVDDRPRELRGRLGLLPRVGLRAGEAFPAGNDWPRIANWPKLEELALALEADVWPFLLLAEPESGTGLLRQWQPPGGAGPMRHLGYAVQWFALAVAVIVIAVVLYRRRSRA